MEAGQVARELVDGGSRRCGPPGAGTAPAARTRARGCGRTWPTPCARRCRCSPVRGLARRLAVWRVRVVGHDEVASSRLAISTTTRAASRPFSVWRATACSRFSVVRITLAIGQLVVQRHAGHAGGRLVGHQLEVVGLAADDAAQRHQRVVAALLGHRLQRHRDSPARRAPARGRCPAAATPSAGQFVLAGLRQRVGDALVEAGLHDADAQPLAVERCRPCPCLRQTSMSLSVAVRREVAGDLEAVAGHAGHAARRAHAGSCGARRTRAGSARRCRRCAGPCGRARAPAPARAVPSNCASSCSARSRRS